MNNYRTNCNNRRVMPGSSQCMSNAQNYYAQKTENMPYNYPNRVCADMPNNREADCERSSNGTQNCQTTSCGCNDIQSNQNTNCNCSCNETPNHQNNHCDCKETLCEQDCNCNHSQNNDCDCNDTQSGQGCHCDCNHSQNNNCTMPESSACRPEPTLCEFPIGMAYVPIQQWRRLYDICTAFRNGTLFQELNLDFLGRRCN